jgi:outer membrane lipoprotein SlyB
MSGDAPPRAPSSFSRPAALIGGAVALVALTAIATTLAVRPATGPGAGGDAAGGSAALAASPAEADVRTPPSAKATGAVRESAAAKPPPAAAPSRATTASVCAQCGVVESVTAVQHKGEGTGVGAVGGAVVGGLLGSAMGGGDGKKAMTVIGAVGGGLAGHEIEKRQRATTVYQVKVRMDDGSVRTLNQATAPPVGQKVTVEGTVIKARA